jgi:hypothetical protein
MCSSARSASIRTRLRRRAGATPPAPAPRRRTRRRPRCRRLEPPVALPHVLAPLVLQLAQRHPEGVAHRPVQVPHLAPVLHQQLEPRSSRAAADVVHRGGGEQVGQARPVRPRRPRSASESHAGRGPAGTRRAASRRSRSPSSPRRSPRTPRRTSGGWPRQVRAERHVRDLVPQRRRRAGRAHARHRIRRDHDDALVRERHPARPLRRPAARGRGERLRRRRQHDERGVGARTGADAGILHGPERRLQRLPREGAVPRRVRDADGAGGERVGGGLRRGGRAARGGREAGRAASVRKRRRPALPLPAAPGPCRNAPPRG